LNLYVLESDSAKKGNSVALQEMTAVINCEREALEFETVPEFLRDSQLPSREAAVSMSSQMLNDRNMQDPEMVEAEAPKSDELEALWPGVHHDFEPSRGRPASLYLTIGFMAGAVISLVSVFGYSVVSHAVASKAPSGQQTIASNTDASKTPTPGGPQTVTGQDGSETLVPATNSYQVAPGDTLAGIALKNYKKVSPRLLDQICRANNMRNANVLSLGQKLTLPEYKAQATPATQVADTGAGRIQ
jgi:LysM repeat protein